MEGRETRLLKLVGRYTTDEGLHHLDNYAFHGVDNSWLAAHGLNAFWNWIVEFLPLWVAPNVVTLAGFLCQVAAFALMSSHNDDFEKLVPWWVYFCCALGLFAYQTLDNIDGKQARRTRSSSPLGELFDHVSDAMGVGMIVTTIGAAGRIGTWWTLVALFCTITPFLFYHWEEYYTGELILGQFDGPTETQCAVMLLHCFSGLLVLTGNGDWWLNETAVPYVGVYQNRSIMSFGYCTLCFLSSVGLQRRMWRYTSSKGIPAWQVLRTALPFTVFMASAVTFAYYNPAVLSVEGARLLFFLYTLLFGYLTSRLITQRVLKEKAEIMYPILVPLLLAALYSVLHHGLQVGLPEYDSHLLLQVLCVLALLQCGLFFVTLNEELTTYLGIRTFFIPYPPPPPKASSVRCHAEATRARVQMSFHSSATTATTTTKARNGSRSQGRSRSRSRSRSAKKKQ